MEERGKKGGGVHVGRLPQTVARDKSITVKPWATVAPDKEVKGRAMLCM